MAEENIVVNEDVYEYEAPEDEKETPKNEQPADEAQEVEAEEVDEIPSYEQEAREDGWRPLEEWDGDPDDWVDAKEFNFRGKLMKRIQQQSSELNNIKKENKEVKDALRALGEHNKKIAEQEYKRAVKDLKQRKVEALENNEHQTVLEIDDQIEDLQTAHRELAAEQDEVVPDKESDKPDSLPGPVQKWLDSDKNSWYHEDAIMRGAADALYVEYLGKHPEDFTGALEHVENNMRKRFPNELGGQQKPGKSAVTEPSGRASASKKQGRTKKFTSRDLNDEQRTVAQTFVRQGVFKDVQEYVDQLVDTGELG